MLYLALTDLLFLHTNITLTAFDAKCGGEKVNKRLVKHISFIFSEQLLHFLLEPCNTVMVLSTLLCVFVAGSLVFTPSSGET